MNKRLISIALLSITSAAHAGYKIEVKDRILSVPAEVTEALNHYDRRSEMKRSINALRSGVVYDQNIIPAESYLLSVIEKGDSSGITVLNADGSVAGCYVNCYANCHGSRGWR